MIYLNIALLGVNVLMGYMSGGGVKAAGAVICAALVGFSLATQLLTTK